MPQPNPEEREPDPLLAYIVEGPATQPAEPAEVSAREQDPPPGDDLRPRLERAERQVERALIEISTLKSDLATLVSAIDELKRRTSRAGASGEGGPSSQPKKLAAQPLGKAPWRRVVAAILLALTAGH